MKKYIGGMIIVILVSLFALRPLFHSGFFSMHDDTQVGRVIVMGRALRLGQFPVRWVSDLGYGYGYPIYNFYGPLPYYAGGALYALGFTGLVATKVMFGLGILMAAIFMYVAVSYIWGINAGILASVLYTYAPYHAVQIYVRGAVGEFWAYAFLPLLILGAYLAYEHKIRRAMLFLAVGMFGVITSHTIMGYVIGGCAIVVLCIKYILMLLQKYSKLSFGIQVKGILLGLGLSAFFWLPVAFERSYTNVVSQIGPTAAYSDHFVCLTQLWDSAWGFAGTAPGCIDGMSYRLGKIHVVLAALGLLTFIWAILRKRFDRLTLFGWATVVGIASIFMMTEVSKSIWDVIPGSAYVQYPWRFLMFAVLSLSLLGSGFLSRVGGRVIRFLGMSVAVVGILFVYSKLFVPQRFVDIPTSSYESDEELRYRVSRISDEYLPATVKRPDNVSEIVKNTIEPSDMYTVKTVQDTDTYSRFAFDTQKEQTVTIHKAYFPGWTYRVNSIYVEPVLKDGIPTVTIPKNESTLEIQFKNTWVRSIANIISLVSFVGMVIFYGKGKKINA
jgi:hypothetical protein